MCRRSLILVVLLVAGCEPSMKGVATPAKPQEGVAVGARKQEAKPQPETPPAVPMTVPAAREVRPSRLSPGDDAITCELDTKGQPWGVRNLDDFAEVKEAKRLNDPAGIAAMEARGRFFRLNSGIKLKVIERVAEGETATTDIYKVRIADGEPAIEHSRRTSYGELLLMYSPYIEKK